MARVGDGLDPGAIDFQVHQEDVVVVPVERDQKLSIRCTPGR